MVNYISINESIRVVLPVTVQAVSCNEYYWYCINLYFVNFYLANCWSSKDCFGSFISNNVIQSFKKNDHNALIHTGNIVIFTSKMAGRTKSLKRPSKQNTRCSQTRFKEKCFYIRVSTVVLEGVIWRFGFGMFSNCFLPELDPNLDLNAYIWTQSK